MSEFRKVSDINMSTDEGKSISDNDDMEISETAMNGNPNNTVSMSDESVVENTEAMDTDMENDEADIQANWNVGDVIMCQWGPNQNIYYEGKITEVDNLMGQPRYSVHYKGWGAKYDEKFLHEDALKFFKPATEELKQRTKDAIEEEKSKKSKNKRSMSISPIVTGKSIGESGAGNHKSKKISNIFARHSRSSDRNGSKKRGRISSDMSNTDTPVSSRPVKMRMEDTVKVREKEIVPIKLTSSLKKVMTCDKELYLGFYLPSIPARSSIDEILKRVFLFPFLTVIIIAFKYYESMPRDADTRREFGSKLQKLFNLYVGDYVISNFEDLMYQDIVQGNEPYYYGLDRCKPKHLGNAKISKENDGSVKMSSLFGLPHLLRFLHTAHEICRDSLNRLDTENFLRWAADFVKFLDARVKTFFDKEQDFYPAAVTYLTRFYSNKFEYQWK